MKAFNKMAADGCTKWVEYISAITVAIKLTRTMSMSRSRIIHRGVVLTLNHLKILKSSSLFINVSIYYVLNHFFIVHLINPIKSPTGLSANLQDRKSNNFLPINNTMIEKTCDMELRGLRQHQRSQVKHLAIGISLFLQGKGIGTRGRGHTPQPERKMCDLN